MRVPLLRGGRVVGYALIDAEDGDRVLAHHWYPHGRGYAAAKISRRTVLLHRFVMGLEAGDGREADHESRDRLDCRRANLRVVTHAQNAQNRGGMGGTSRFRGVARYRDRYGERWQVQVCVAGKRIKVGYRCDEIDAALLAHEARCRLMPFAKPDPELVALGLV